MSDKPTKSKVQEKILSGLECDSNRTWARMIIDRIDTYFPEVFAPEPDPVEEYTDMVCERCAHNGICESDDESESINRCRTKRDALRAYVADLRERAEGK